MDLVEQLMADYLANSAFWAVLWFLVGCVVGWLIRGVHEMRG